MIFEKGYTFKKVKTSHGSTMYVSKFGQIVKVVPCSSQISISHAYASNLIRQIESKE
jgi:hypothetical protein